MPDGGHTYHEHEDASQPSGAPKYLEVAFYSFPHSFFVPDGGHMYNEHGDAGQPSGTPKYLEGASTGWLVPVN